MPEKLDRRKRDRTTVLERSALVVRCHTPYNIIGMSTGRDGASPTLSKNSTIVYPLLEGTQ